MRENAEDVADLITVDGKAIRSTGKKDKAHYRMTLRNGRYATSITMFGETPKAAKKASLSAFCASWLRTTAQ